MKKLLAPTLLILLTLLSSCAATEQTTNQPLPREEPTNTTHNPTTIPEDGLQRWRTYEQNAATFLVNDGAIAVRAFLQEGEEITLELKEQTTIKIGTVEQTQAQFIINNQTTTLQEGETTKREVVNIQLTETITKN